MAEDLQTVSLEVERIHLKEEGLRSVSNTKRVDKSTTPPKERLRGTQGKPGIADDLSLKSHRSGKRDTGPGNTEEQVWLQYGLQH